MGVRWYWFLPRDERGWRETGGGNERGEAKEMERDERRDTKGSWEVRPREEVRARVEVNEGARKVFKECEGDDAIEEEQHERGAG